MNDQDQIRRDQIEQGRKMGRLGVPERIEVLNPDYNRPRCKPSPAKQLTGHEAYIENLRTSAAEVKLYLVGNISSVGVVRAADKYTISIATADGTVEVVFKSGIVKLVPTKRGVKKND